MASFVLFIVTIFLLPAARSADPPTLFLECNECFGDDAKTCSDSGKNCTNEEKCLAVISKANLSLEHSFITSFARSCVTPSSDLMGSFYFNFGDRRILQFNSRVCNETEPECKTALAEPDSMDIFENGKYCPKCFRTGYDNCESDGDELCVGNFVNCTEVNGEITNIDSGAKIPFAGKGCVSRSVCNLNGTSFHHGTYKFTFKNLQCSQANGALSSLRRLAFTLEKKDLGPQAAFFFPCILGIFAVKILS